MITIEEALRIALEAHEGQKDLDGNPVILHPMAVALAGRNRQEQIAGLLHDVVGGREHCRYIAPTYTFEGYDLRRVCKNAL